MIKKLIFSLLLLTLCVLTSVNAKTIIWVTEVQDQDNDGTNDSKVWADKLTAAGYTVDFQPGNWDAFTSAKLAQVNAADLVIVSCTTQSGTFTGTGETALWNSVTAPMILCSPYIARSTRWQWINNGDGTLPNNNGDQGSPLLQAVVPTHPVFYGISLDSNSQAKVLDPNLGSGNASFLATNNAGNGTLIAKTVPTSLVQDWCWIVEWKKGVTFYNGSAYTAPNLRMYFTGIGYHEVSGSKPMRGYSLTDQGWKVFLNAVKYMVGDAIDPKLASSPYPENGAAEVSPAVVTYWTPGINTPKHDVYFGTSFADVDNASRTNPLNVLVNQGQDTNSYDPPGSLDYGTTYYWRVDEVGAGMKGNVWSFTIEPRVYAIGSTLGGGTVTATASSKAVGSSEPNTANGKGLTGDLHNDKGGDMWLSDPNNALTPIWIQYKLDGVYKLDSMWVWNYNAEFEDLIGIGVKGATVQYSTDGVDFTNLGDFTFTQAAGLPGYAHVDEVNFGGVAVQYVKILVKSNCGEDLTMGAGLSEVRFLYNRVQATQPVPSDNATGIDPTTVVLGWRAGREVASNKVYIGTDPNALSLAGTVATNSFPPSLILGTKYYWKVDEVNTSTWPSVTWSFTTIDPLPVDNFESYNDTTKLVYDVWIDGYNTPTTNGAQSGYYTADGTPSSMETTAFHGGAKSMPLKYGKNGVTPSEATRTFASAQDWTIAKTLTLFFYGDLANTGGQLYVKINDTKVVYGGDALDVTRPLWRQWNIDLTALPAATVKSVTKLTIGVSGAGTGKLFIDDILLYQAAPAVPAEDYWIEAEDAVTITSPLLILSDVAGASGGKYIQPGAGAVARAATVPSDSGPAGIATYSVKVNGGKYILWGRVSIPLTDSTGDAFYIRIKDATLNTTVSKDGWVMWNGITSGAAWHWRDVYHYASATNFVQVQFALPAGTHTIEIAYRDVGSTLTSSEMLDAFRVVNVP